MKVFFKNFGFTLIELLGIIIIISVIFLFSFVNLSNITKKNKANEYEMFIDELCSVGKYYIESNNEKYTELSMKESKITLDIAFLLKEQLINKNMENPKTKEKVKSGYLIYTVKDDYTLDCEYRY